MNARERFPVGSYVQRRGEVATGRIFKVRALRGGDSPHRLHFEGGPILGEDPADYELVSKPKTVFRVVDRAGNGQHMTESLDLAKAYCERNGVISISRIEEYRLAGFHEATTEIVWKEKV